METVSIQLAFMNNLPSDILSLIFSHLSQKECLNCMAVCRAWYYALPLYTEPVWKAVTLNERDVQLLSKRRELCLGEHVKSVAFENIIGEDKLRILIQKLLGQNCKKVTSIGWYLRNPKIPHIQLTVNDRV